MNISENRRQEKGITLEEHIVRTDGRIVDDIGWDRPDQERQGGQKALLPRFCISIAVISGDHYQKASKQHRTMI